MCATPPHLSSCSTDAEGIAPCFYSLRQLLSTISTLADYLTLRAPRRHLSSLSSPSVLVEKIAHGQGSKDYGKQQTSTPPLSLSALFHILARRLRPHGPGFTRDILLPSGQEWQGGNPRLRRFRTISSGSCADEAFRRAARWHGGAANGEGKLQRFFR